MIGRLIRQSDRHDSNLSRLSEEQDTLALFEPETQQWLHHYQLSWAFPKAKVFLLSELVLWDSPQHAGTTREKVRVVADLTQGYQTWEHLNGLQKERRKKVFWKCFINTELATGERTVIKNWGLSQSYTFKQINIFTLVYWNELHNLFTDINGRFLMKAQRSLH